MELRRSGGEEACYISIFGRPCRLPRWEIYGSARAIEQCVPVVRAGHPRVGEPDHTNPSSRNAGRKTPKESFNRIISVTSRAAPLPLCIAIPREAFLSASTSLTPSPIIATRRPRRISPFADRVRLAGQERLVHLQRALADHHPVHDDLVPGADPHASPVTNSAGTMSLSRPSRTTVTLGLDIRESRSS